WGERIGSHSSGVGSRDRPLLPHARRGQWLVSWCECDAGRGAGSVWGGECPSAHMGLEEWHMPAHVGRDWGLERRSGEPMRNAGRAAGRVWRIGKIASVEPGKRALSAHAERPQWKGEKR